MNFSGFTFDFFVLEKDRVGGVGWFSFLGDKVLSFRCLHMTPQDSNVHFAVLEFIF